MERTTPEQEIEPQFIVKCTTEAVSESLNLPIPNYIYQDEEETPAQNMRSRKHIQHTINQEAILSAMESIYIATATRQCASRKLPRHLLCDLANTVMDSSG